jgi:hypothetical protein
MQRVSLLAIAACILASCKFPYPADVDPDAGSAVSSDSVAASDAMPDSGASADAPDVDASTDAPLPNCASTPVCVAPIDLGMITADPHGTPQPYPVLASYESNGDPSWYRVRLMDTPAPGNLTASIELIMPANTNYDMRVYCSSCGGQLADIGDQAEATREIASVRRDDTSSVDDFDIWIEVKRAPGSAGCGPYRLVVAGNQPVGVATCN